MSAVENGERACPVIAGLRAVISKHSNNGNAFEMTLRSLAEREAPTAHWARAWSGKKVTAAARPPTMHLSAGYRPNSSSANHNSNGAALPPRSITTCLKLASPDAPGFGMETLSPIARMIPCNSNEPKAISTVVPRREEQLISAAFSDILDQRNARAERSSWRSAMFNEGLLNRTLRTTRTNGPV